MPAKGVARSIRAKPAINNNVHIATREIDCQTNDLDQELASDVSQLNSLKKTFDSIAISSRDPNVLLYQQRTSLRLIEKLSSENKKIKQENEKIVNFMGEIFRLVRAMRSEYDSTFVNVQDDFKSMRFDWGRYMTEVSEHFVKQKKSVEDEKKRFKNVMKKKDLHIEDLQSRLNNASEQIKITVQALEAQQRRVTIAQRDVYAANEEVKDVNRKLNDQLYLAAHQKCRSCQANEKVREMLSNEIAEKTAVIDSMRERCAEMDGMLQQQKRVNEILSRSVDKHAFSEKAIRGEFDRIKLENESLLSQIKTLKTSKKVDSTTATVIVAAAAQSASITPPDSSSSDKSVKDEPGNDSQHASLQSTPNAGASNSPKNELPDKGKPPSAAKTLLINRSPHLSTSRSPHSSANCSSPNPNSPNNPQQSKANVVKVNDNNGIPTDMVPLKKKLKKKQQLFTKTIKSNMPMCKSRQIDARKEDLEEGELNEYNKQEQQQPPFKMAQKRTGEGGPNMAMAKKKKSLAIKQKLAVQKRNQTDGHEQIFCPTNGPVNNSMNRFAALKETRFAEPRDTRFINDYEWDDRSVVAEEQRQHDARMRDLQTREFRRASMECELPPQNVPWHDRQMTPFHDNMSRGRNLSAQDLDSCALERSNLCPVPPIAPQLAPPPQMRGFQRCEGATLDDIIKRDNVVGSRRGRIEGQQQRMTPPPPHRFESSMENRVPRTSSSLHYARSFEEPQLPDIRSQVGMFPSSSRAQIPPPPVFMRPPPESPIQRDKMMNNNAMPLQWGNIGRATGGGGGGQPQGVIKSWGGILGPYLHDGPTRQQQALQQQQPPPQNNSWVPNGQNFWRH